MEVRKYTATGRRKTREEMIDSYLANYKVKCKCGHSILMNRDKKICNYCGRLVYRTKQIEFKEKLKGELRKWKKDT